MPVNTISAGKADSPITVYYGERLKITAPDVTDGKFVVAERLQTARLAEWTTADGTWDISHQQLSSPLSEGESYSWMLWSGASNDRTMHAYGTLDYEWAIEGFGVLSADNVATGAPTVGSPTLTQDHSISTNPVATGAPVTSSPVLSESVDVEVFYVSDQNYTVTGEGTSVTLEILAGSSFPVGSYTEDVATQPQIFLDPLDSISGNVVTVELAPAATLEDRIGSLTMDVIWKANGVTVNTVSGVALNADTLTFDASSYPGQTITATQRATDSAGTDERTSAGEIVPGGIISANLVHELDHTGIVDDTVNVTSWTAGTGVNLDENGPLSLAAAPQGQKAGFAASGVGLRSSNVTLISGDAARTGFIVGRWHGSVNQNNAGPGWVHAVTSGNNCFRVPYSFGNLRLDYGDGRIDAGALDTANWHVFAVRYTGSGTQLFTMWWDGVKVVTDQSIGAPLATGSGRAGIQTTTHGGISLVAMYLYSDAKTDQEVADMSSHLRSLYITG